MLNRILTAIRNFFRPPTLSPVEMAFAEAERCARIMRSYGFKSKAWLNNGEFVSFGVAVPIPDSSEDNLIWCQLEPSATPLDVRVAFRNVSLQHIVTLGEKRAA